MDGTESKRRVVWIALICSAIGSGCAYERSQPFTAGPVDGNPSRSTVTKVSATAKPASVTPSSESLAQRTKTIERFEKQICVVKPAKRSSAPLVVDHCVIKADVAQVGYWDDRRREEIESLYPQFIRRLPPTEEARRSIYPERLPRQMSERYDSDRYYGADSRDSRSWHPDDARRWSRYRDEDDYAWSRGGDDRPLRSARSEPRAMNSYSDRRDNTRDDFYPASDREFDRRLPRYADRYDSRSERFDTRYDSRYDSRYDDRRSDPRYDPRYDREPQRPARRYEEIDAPERAAPHRPDYRAPDDDRHPEYRYPNEAPREEYDRAYDRDTRQDDFARDRRPPRPAFAATTNNRSAIEKLPAVANSEVVPSATTNQTTKPAAPAEKPADAAAAPESNNAANVNKEAASPATKNEEQPAVPAAEANVVEPTLNGPDQAARLEKAFVPKLVTNPTATDNAPATPVPLGPNPAIASVATRADQLARHALTLARRGAFYSARAELIQAMRLVAQALDAEAGNHSHSQKLAAGLRALEEADDFAPQGSRLEANLDLRAIIATHRTPILKNVNADTLLPVAALQSYYTFGQQQIAESLGHEPAASLALYGMGKLYTSITNQPGQFGQMSGPKALAFHQAATLVDPANFRSSNELGVLLAKFGQLQEAKQALLQSVAVQPMPETWHNLATVHERLGERSLAQQARQEQQIVAQRAGPTNPLNSPAFAVQWLPPTEFARQTPSSTEGWNSPAAPQPAAPSAAPTATTARMAPAPQNANGLNWGPWGGAVAR